jgi:hypothetical protein
MRLADRGLAEDLVDPAQVPQPRLGLTNSKPLPPRAGTGLAVTRSITARGGAFDPDLVAHAPVHQRIVDPRPAAVTPAHPLGGEHAYRKLHS